MNRYADSHGEYLAHSFVFLQPTVGTKFRLSTRSGRFWQEWRGASGWSAQTECCALLLGGELASDEQDDRLAAPRGELLAHPLRHLASVVGRTVGATAHSGPEEHEENVVAQLCVCDLYYAAVTVAGAVFTWGVTPAVLHQVSLLCEAAPPSRSGDDEGGPKSESSRRHEDATGPDQPLGCAVEALDGPPPA